MLGGRRGDRTTQTCTKWLLWGAAFSSHTLYFSDATEQRIRMCDFLLAAHSVPAAAKWVHKFKKMYGEAKLTIGLKMENARGVVNSKASNIKHMIYIYIYIWR